MAIERWVQGMVIDAQLGPAPDGFAQKVKVGNKVFQVTGEVIYSYLWNNRCVDTSKRPRFQSVDHVVNNRRYHEYELWVVETAVLKGTGQAGGEQEGKQLYLLGIPDGRVYHLIDQGQDLSENGWLGHGAKSEASLPELSGREARKVRGLVIEAVKQERKRSKGLMQFLDYLIGRRLLGGVERD